jgi:hypothetical protein
MFMFLAVASLLEVGGQISTSTLACTWSIKMSRKSFDPRSGSEDGGFLTPKPSKSLDHDIVLKPLQN